MITKRFLLAGLLPALLVTGAANAQDVPLDMEIGYRWSNVKGNQEMFRSQLNEQAGMQLRSLSWGLGDPCVQSPSVWPHPHEGPPGPPDNRFPQKRLLPRPKYVPTPDIPIPAASLSHVHPVFEESPRPLPWRKTTRVPYELSAPHRSLQVEPYGLERS